MNVRMRMRYVCVVCNVFVGNDAQMAKHTGSARCRATKLAREITARGLVRVELKRLNIVAKHIAAGLAEFGYPNEIHLTRLTGGAQVWTNAEGHAHAHTTLAVAQLLNLSYPEASRRLREAPSVIAPFAVARGLNATDQHLRALLVPIDYVIGSNGKRRPSVPFTLVLGWR